MKIQLFLMTIGTAMTVMASASPAFAAPQLNCKPEGQAEVEFTSQATVISESQVSDLTVHYAGSPQSKAGLTQGQLVKEGEMTGMTAFLIEVDGGALGIVVPRGFTRMKTSFKGYFILGGGAGGGASPISCSIN
jgi:hypothetical protein